jgi:hypothetical protein
VENPNGVFQAHCYRFDQNTSTFIVECDEDRGGTRDSIAWIWTPPSRPAKRCSGPGSTGIV